MNKRGKSIKIYLHGGDLDGIKTVTRSNWDGMVIVCPKACINKLGSSDGQNICKNPGVYFLLMEDLNTTATSVYVGESEDCPKRLLDHLRKREFMQVFIFTSKDGDITKAHFRYLEQRMIKKIQESKQVTLDNKNLRDQNNKDNKHRGLKFEDQEIADEYLEKAEDILPAIGFLYLKPTISPKEETEQSNEKSNKKPRIFSFTERGSKYNGKGRYTDEGFVVLKGSFGKYNQDRIEKWKNFHESRKIKKISISKDHSKIHFEDDVRFTSSSAAASILAGGLRNGQKCWKDSAGRDIQSLIKESFDLQFESVVDEEPATKKKRTKKSDDQPKRSATKPASTSRTIRIKQLLDAGLIKAGDEIWLQDKPSIKATMTKDGECIFRKEQMSLNKYAEKVNEKTINIYKQIIHGRSGKLLDSLRSRLK